MKKFAPEKLVYCSGCGKKLLYEYCVTYPAYSGVPDEPRLALHSCLTCTAPSWWSPPVEGVSKRPVGAACIEVLAVGARRFLVVEMRK